MPKTESFQPLLYEPLRNHVQGSGEGEGNFVTDKKEGKKEEYEDI